MVRAGSQSEHELGLAEAVRIEAEIARVAADAGYAGDLAGCRSRNPCVQRSVSEDRQIVRERRRATRARRVADREQAIAAMASRLSLSAYISSTGCRRTSGEAARALDDSYLPPRRVSASGCSRRR
jgi:hypothetical protein